MSLDLADYKRFYRLYHYLFACLAMKQKADGLPNYKAISERLSHKADFRKIVSSLLQHSGDPSFYSEKIKISSATTAEVVKMLLKLSESLKADYQNHEEPYTKVLSSEDILTVLYQLIELTPDERQDLGLLANDNLTLLQRALMTLQIGGGLDNYEMIFRIYKSAVGLDFSKAEPVLENLLEVDQLIEGTIHQSLAYLPPRASRNQNSTIISPGRDKTIEELTQKAKREIRRLLARSGNQQSPVLGSAVVDSYVRHYLQPAFVVKLAQSVVVNERLTDRLPVYLKRITIEACGPLPFAVKGLAVSQQADSPYPPLLHPIFWQLDQDSALDVNHSLSGPGDYDLASQEATRIVVEFYVKLHEAYSPSVERIFKRLVSGKQRRIDFSLASTGIGGSLSHVIKVINKALLYDIPCLSDYFPIAHDVTSTQQIIRENVPSPVWAHSLVKLCQKSTLGQALESSNAAHLCSFEEFAFANPVGHGDYCGFDFLLSQAQAALHARLQAVRNTGVIPDVYISELGNRVERLLSFNDAWSYLQGYPFSAMAMIGVIHQEILPSNGKATLYGGNQPLTKRDPYTQFDACLLIIEALLDEGAYRPACRYLKRIELLEDYVSQGLAIAEFTVSNGNEFEVFSGSLIVRYLLCKATYCYLYDTRNEDPYYLPPGSDTDINRQVLVQKTWSLLDAAQQHVSIRLQKYVILNEVSQGTFHPHYGLLGRIALLRSKLLLFFPHYVPKSERRLPTESFLGQQRIPASIHWGRLYLLEKARLYAASDGNSAIYSCYSAIQSWMHLMAAYEDERDLTLHSTNATQNSSPKTLSSRECLKWAKRLRDHALISYAETGRQCYFQIKEKSGLPNQYEDFGACQIQKLPAIYEAKGEEYPYLRRANQTALVLDMTLLAVSPDDLPKVSPNHPARPIYLFGTNACYLFFSRGMYLLCSDAVEEFNEYRVLENLDDWNEKLNRSLRLFDMAWAIAEEGGSIQKNKRGEEATFVISRLLSSDKLTSEYTSPEVESVRDLYPRRISEIAALGKVFSATCMALSLHLAPEEQQSEKLSNIEKILNSLHDAHHLNGMLRALMARQKRYNGHLESHLEKMSVCIRKHASNAHRVTSPNELKLFRDAFLKELFSTFIT